MTARRANSMSDVTRYTASTRFRIWRWLYAIILVCWTIPWFVAAHSLDWSVDVGYYNLYFGLLPAAVFLLLRLADSRWAGWFAYAYDVFIFLALVVALIGLPNYMGLGFLLPLVGFLCEGILLTVVLVRDRRQ